MNDGMTADNRELTQAAMGGQAHLRITQVPSGAAANLIGKQLKDAGSLTVAGDYYCRFRCGGLLSLNVHLKATFGGGETVTSEVFTCYMDGWPDNLPSAATSYQGFSSDGALSTGSLQSPALTATKGEQYAIVKIAITGTGGVTFTVAEFNGI